MRKLMAAVVLTLAASWAIAQEPAVGAPATDKDTKEMTAVVVAADPTVKTITVKREMGAGQTGTPEKTISVDEKAIARLKTVKAGEKVKLVLKTDPATKQESVTAIEKPAPSEPQ
jgi:Cu/Ag efflux protein CusF